MSRALTFTLAALLLLSCASDEDKAIQIDFAIGDQCAWMPPERPDNCASHPPCIYSDADLHIQRTSTGAYQLTANASGWGGNHPSDREITTDATSVNALAMQFPNVLRALDGETQVPSSACVYLNPSQDMSVGDVVAFHDAIAAQRVRKIGFYSVLADDWR